MTSKTHHLGIYTWFDENGAQRPMPGSAQYERDHKAWLRYRAEALNTPEGQAWTAKHGFTKTKHEDLEWLTANDKI